MLLSALSDRRALFVGGKGGVGKTTVAGALALAAARRGRRCLLVSTDPAHSLGDLFARPVGDRPTALAPGLWGRELDPRAAVDAYIDGVAASLRALTSPELAGAVQAHLDAAREAPGALEAALLEQVSGLLLADDGDHDLVVFDTAPSGHTLQLLRLPGLLARWTEGLVDARERAERFADVLGAGEEAQRGRDERIRALLAARQRRHAAAAARLADPAHTAFVLVLTAEALPIAESARALEALRQAGIDVVAGVVNRLLPDAAEGAFVDARRRQERARLEEARQRLAGLPLLEVPLAPADIRGVAALEDLAERLAGR